MKMIRSSVDAMLVDLLLKRMVRRSIAKWRRQARQTAETVVLPAQAWLEGVLSTQTEPRGRLARPAGQDQPAAQPGGDASRTMLIIGLVAGLTAIISAIALAAVWRRRRAAARAKRLAAREPIAIPIVTPEEAQEASEDLARTPGPR